MQHKFQTEQQLTVTPAQAKPRAFLTQRGRQLPSQFASSNSPRFAALHDDQSSQRSLIEESVSDQAVRPTQRKCAVPKSELLNRYNKVVTRSKGIVPKRFAPFAAEQLSKSHNILSGHHNARRLQKYLIKAEAEMRNRNYFDALMQFQRAISALGVEDNDALSLSEVCQSVDQLTSECILFINYQVTSCYLKEKQLDQALEHVGKLIDTEPRSCDALELKCKVLIKFVVDSNSEQGDGASSSDISIKSLTSNEAAHMCNETLDQLEKLTCSTKASSQHGQRSSARKESRAKTATEITENMLMYQTGNQESAGSRAGSALTRPTNLRVILLRLLNLAAILYAAIAIFRSRAAKKMLALLFRFLKARFFYVFGAKQWFKY